MPLLVATKTDIRIDFCGSFTLYGCFCVSKNTDPDRIENGWNVLCLTRVRARSVVSDKQEEGKKKTAARDINTLLCACIVCAYKQHKVLLLIVTTATQPKRKPVCERQDAMQFHSIAQAIE